LTGAERARALLAQGLALHRQGELVRADALYRESMLSDASADALHLRGLVAHQQGLHAQGERLIREAIGRGPPNAAWLNNLGETLRVQGRIEEAQRAYRDALECDPRCADARGNLALALAGSGRLEEALPHAQQACALAPDAFEAHMVHAELLRQLSRFTDALAAYEQALRLRPDLVAAWVNAALSLLMLNRNAQAREYFQRALALEPASPQAATGLGLALIALRELDAAERSLELALRAVPEYPDALVALARLRRIQRRHTDAVEIAHRALRHDAQVQGAHAVMGSALKSLGRFQQAVAELEQALARNAQDVEAMCALAELRDRLTPRHTLLARIEALLAQPGYGELERVQMHFAAAALHDEAGDHRAAFVHLRGGNRLVRASLDFDIARVRDEVDALIETVDAKFLADRAALACASEVPIFIFGMPRSGTTLCEQILSMHGAVFGAGEVGIRRHVPVADAQLARWLSRLDEQQAAQLASRYLAALGADAGAAERITDKMPGNFFYLGLIALLFPRAPLLHCTRAAADTCLSVYMQHFSQPEGHPYAYDLGELGLYYREYARLMRHWREVLGARMHEVRYERLVRTPEPEIRALVAHCALAWDPRCMQHTQNTRAVTTLSAWQARQPIYHTSLERWRRYAPDLGELIAALGDEAGDTAAAGN